MGRIITAVALSFFSAMGFGVSIFMIILNLPSGKPNMFWEILTTITLIGIFVPVPVSLLLNLRDWLRARKKSSP